MVGQHPLHLDGVDVVATSQVALALPARQGEVALGVEPAHVAHGHPSVGVQGGGRGLLVPPVGPHHGLGADLHPAQDAPLHRAPVPPHHSKLDSGSGPADSLDHDLVGVPGPGAGDDASRLGGRVTVDDGHAEGGPHAPQQVGGHPGAPGSRQAQAGEVSGLQGGLAQHELPLGGHPLGHSYPLVLDQAQGVRRRPPGRRDDGGDDLADLVPGPGHGAHVGEGDRRETPVERSRQHAGELGHRGQVVVVEHGPLGPSRGSPGPADEHGPADAHGRQRRPRGVPVGRQLGPAQLQAGRGGQLAPVPVVHHRGPGPGPGHDVAHLVGPQALVDAAGDGAQAHEGLVAHHVLERRGQQEAHHVPSGHALVAQTCGDPVGRPVPPPVGQAAAGGVDEGVDRGMLGRHVADQVDGVHPGSFNTRSAFWRRNLGHTSSLKPTPSSSAKILSSSRPHG